MKRLILALAAITLFLTAAALPSLADGNPMPVCTKKGCTKPLPDIASAITWQELYAWMVGNAVTQACAPDSSGYIWTCGLETPAGAGLLLVWDSSQTCTVVGCTYSSYAVPSGPGYSQYYTLGAQTSTPLGSTVNVGCYPILLSQ